MRCLDQAASGNPSVKSNKPGLLSPGLSNLSNGFVAYFVGSTVGAAASDARVRSLEGSRSVTSVVVLLRIVWI